MNSVIISPVISEQSMDQSAKGRYTFTVSKSASKTMIKKAIENRFKVNVTSVTTSIVKGRTKRIGNRRMEVVGSPWKKATVSLKTGQKLDMFDIGGQK